MLSFEYLEVIPAQTSYQPVHAVEDGDRDQDEVDKNLQRLASAVELWPTHQHFVLDGALGARLDMYVVNGTLGSSRRNGPGGDNSQQDSENGVRRNRYTAPHRLPAHLTRRGATTFHNLLLSSSPYIGNPAETLNREKCHLIFPVQN